MKEGFKNYIQDHFLKSFSAEMLMAGNEVVLLIDPENLRFLLIELRDDIQTLFSQLVSVNGVDYPHLEKRFEVIYNLLSLKRNERIRIKVKLAEGETIPSIKDIFTVASWYERETYDMYGIVFAHNDDLRRILTDYGFTHFPLRKDIPLTGYDEVRYDENQKKVIYEPVKLDQEFRNFDFTSPWQGDKPIILPGDEKATEIDEK